MKFATKVPQSDKKISEALLKDGWKRLKEPKNLAISILISMPIAIINAFISYIVIIQFYNPIAKVIASRSFDFTINILDVVCFVLAMIMIVIVHELLHIIFIPNFAKSDKTYFGIALFGGFTYTSEKISKNRFIVISVMPFVIISVILPIILGVFNGLNGFIMFLIILNAASSYVDIFNLFIILFQVPKKSFIINNGFETYFK